MLKARGRQHFLDAIENGAKRNMINWTLLFSGASTVSFSELCGWPMRKALEMLYAHEVWAKNQRKAADREIQSVREGAGDESKAWWEKGI